MKTLSEKVILLSVLSLLNNVSAASAADAVENNLRRQTDLTEPGKSANAWEPYVEDIEKRIKQAWKPKTVGEPIGCMLNLMLNPNGSIRKAGIQNSSKDAEFDTAALKAMVAASPFPSLFDKNLDQLYLHVSFRNRSNGNDCKAFIFLPSSYKEAQPERSEPKSINTNRKLLESGENAITKFRTATSSKSNSETNELASNEESETQMTIDNTTNGARASELTVAPGYMQMERAMLKRRIANLEKSGHELLPVREKFLRLNRLVLIPGSHHEVAIAVKALNNSLDELSAKERDGSPQYSGNTGLPIQDEAGSSGASKKTLAPIPQSYFDNVRNRLNRAWIAPKNCGNDTAATVRFTIHQNGTMSDLVIKDLSERSDLVNSGLKAVQNSAPFKPLPNGSPHQICVEYTFDADAMSKPVPTRSSGSSKE